MDLGEIKLLTKKYLTSLGVWRKHMHSKIYRHWEIMLLTFIVINIFQLGFSLYIFLQINEGGIFLVEQNQEVRIDTIDRTVLQELLSSFEIKDVLFEERSIHPPRLSDPS